MGTYYPGPPWVDQYGNTYANRAKRPTTRKDRDIHQRLPRLQGPRFYGVRLGSGSLVETLYPITGRALQFSYWR